MGFGGKIKRNIADKHLSDCVRKGAHIDGKPAPWHCQRCEKDYTDRPQGLQCSHFIGRGSWAVRYDPYNCISLCAYCHNLVESNPPEHMRLREVIHGGDDELEKLVQRSNCKGRAQYARANIKAISAHYRGESKRLDSELKKAKEGKKHDLKVYGYIKPPTPSDT